MFFEISINQNQDGETIAKRGKFAILTPKIIPKVPSPFGRGPG
jgi:hypothetical protein